METVNKYNGKTIRIEGTVYRIEVIATKAEISVYLHPLSQGTIAYSKTEFDDYGYTHGGKTYKLAVQKAKEIEKEVEDNFETDF